MFYSLNPSRNVQFGVQLIYTLPSLFHASGCRYAVFYNVGRVEDSLALVWEKYKEFYFCLFSTHLILKLIK